MFPLYVMVIVMAALLAYLIREHQKSVAYRFDRLTRLVDQALNDQRKPVFLDGNEEDEPLIEIWRNRDSQFLFFIEDDDKDVFFGMDKEVAIRLLKELVAQIEGESQFHK